MHVKMFLGMNEMIYLAVFAINDILLSVEEPVRDFVLARIRHNRDDLLDFLLGALAGAFVQINIGLLQNNVGVSSAYTFDGCHGKHHLTFAVDVRTHDTKNVLELLWYDERLQQKS